ncbi:MAG: hydantoinase B/oxoprolinase family protein [Candidatus Hydrothermarchaeota archaeon]
MLTPIELEVFKNRVTAIAEEMGLVLQRAAQSSNIKERRDFSTAIFDFGGELVAQAEHIPVHLGSMPYCLKNVLEEVEIKENDVIITNDPFKGGTHLPDVTVITPVYFKELIGFLVNRAHHADIGGITAGSMAGNTFEIFQEGLRIPPVKLYKGGTMDEEILSLFLANVRDPKERLGDLYAQVAANFLGKERMKELYEKFREKLLYSFEEIKNYSERMMLSQISKYRGKEGKGVDFLDDGSKIEVSVKVEEDKIVVDFDGTSDMVDGNLNCPYAVTLSCVYYVIRCVTDPSIPPNAGCYRPIDVNIPKNSLLNASYPKGVVGGNVETSQRIVEALLIAFREITGMKIAQSQGTMNNVAIGTSEFTYYETIGGGYGASDRADGVDGIHVHMTNTQNTPVEALEMRYPLRIERYELIENSGGYGKYRGGLGIRRDIRVLTKARLSLLSERRKIPPRGIEMGEDGSKGLDIMIKDGKEIILSGKEIIDVEPDTIISIRTPGGGGYGNLGERDREKILKDLKDEKYTIEFIRERYPIHLLKG